MKSVKVLMVAFLVVVLALASTISVGAVQGNNTGIEYPPIMPDDGYQDGYWNVGKTKLSAAFAYSGDQDISSYKVIPDPGKGKRVIEYVFVGDAPTKVCFPIKIGSTTKIYFENPNTNEWVQPGLRTKNEIHFSVKYRCADAIANGYYGLIGK